MEYLSIVISVIALLVSFYFSYKPYRERRKGLKAKLHMYRDAFQAMVKEWEHNRDWIAQLKDSPSDQMYKGVIHFQKEIFELYPLNESDLVILAGLGYYDEDFGYGSKDKAPFLKLKFFIQDFIDENSHNMMNGFIKYDFADRGLAEHYVNKNGDSDYCFSLFLVGFIDSVLKRL